MKAKATLPAIGIFALAWLVVVFTYPSQEDVKQEARQVGEYKISGPWTHENLSVYLIHGEDKMKNWRFLTLEEAMEQKKVIVHETGEVNELAIENVSDNEDVFVQSGDIVKGGQQDRVLAVDFIVPPKSGKMPIASFCVESGRWSKRGGESSSQFALSEVADAPAQNFEAIPTRLPTKELKLAANKDVSQSEVWEEVSKTQQRLAGQGALGACFSIPQESPSSLQLTLEDGSVKKMAQEYLDKLALIADGKKDVIGYVFAINGEVNSGDIYASNELFKKMWRKLLKASAIEAITKLQKDQKFNSPDIEAVNACLADAAKGKPSDKDINKRVKMVTRETEKNILFETQDKKQRADWLHRNYMAK